MEGHDTVIGSRFIALSLAGFALFSTWGAQAEAGKQWTKIRIETEGAFRPWNFTNPDGTLGGFEIDLAKDLCARIKLECTIEAQAFDGAIPALNAGKFDVIMSGMSVTPKREEAILFSVPYGSTGQSFAVLKDGPLAKLPGKDNVYSLTSDEPGAIKALDELKPTLKGKVIGVQSASIAAAFVEKYLKGVVEAREYKTTDQHDLDLNAGRVDIIMASMAYLGGTIVKDGNKDMAIVGPRFQGGVLGKGSAVGIRKTDPELKAMFDDAIKGAQADGTILKLSMKWFGFDVTPR